MYLALALALAQILTPPVLAQAEPTAPRAEAPSPGETSEPATAPGRGEVLVRVRGDAYVPEGERVGLVVVVDGEARIEGTVGALAVFRGDAILEGARVGDMLVYEGHATLGPQTVIGGDLHVVDAQIEAADDAVVMGDVVRDSPPWELPGLTLFGTLFGLGVAIAFILAGVLAAAIAPHGVRRVGHALTHEIGKTLLAALVVWIAIPLLAGGAMVTVVAAPLGMAILGIALPALAFVGYLVAGIRVGDAFLSTTRRRQEVRPIGAAAAGLAILLGLSLVPILGSIVNLLAVLLGGAALGLTVWRLARNSAQPAAA